MVLYQVSIARFFRARVLWTFALLKMASILTIQTSNVQWHGGSEDMGGIELFPYLCNTFGKG